MKFVRISDSSANDIEKFVNLHCLCVFHYSRFNVDISLFERQDDCLFVKVLDHCEELCFYFQLFYTDSIDIYSFSKFRKVLIRLYFRFLDDYRKSYIDSFLENVL